MEKEYINLTLIGLASKKHQYRRNKNFVDDLNLAEQFFRYWVDTKGCETHEDWETCLERDFESGNYSSDVAHIKKYLSISNTAAMDRTTLIRLKTVLTKIPQYKEIAEEASARLEYLNNAFSKWEEKKRKERDLLAREHSDGIEANLDRLSDPSRALKEHYRRKTN